MSCSSIASCLLGTSFSDKELQRLALLQQSPQQHIHVQSSSSKPYPQYHSTLPAEIAHSCINLLAMIYAGNKIYARYQMIGASQIERSVLQRMIYSVYTHSCPSFLQSLLTQGSFCVDVVGVAVEALLYKSVGKIIFFCCAHDIPDMVWLVIAKGKRILRLPMSFA